MSTPRPSHGLPAALTLHPRQWPFTFSQMFASQSYRHLLAAERAIAKDIQDATTTPAARAQAARALVAVLEEKRIQRLRPAPKPVEVPAPGSRKRRRAHSVEADLMPVPPVVLPAEAQRAAQ